MTTILRRRRSEVRLIERVSWVRAIFAWAVALIFFFPVLYLFVTGFKSEESALKLPPTLIPAGDSGLPLTFSFTTQNYSAVLDRSFWPFFQNSLIAVAISTLLVVALALPCAYALTWHKHEHSRDILFFFLSTKFLPSVGVIIAVYYIAKLGHMIDQLPTLIVMYIAMNLPIAIWMLRSFLDEVPKEVLDACRVDGANVRQELFRVALPMILAGLVSTLFICAIFAWNEYFLAVTLMATKGATVPMFMIGFVTSEGLFWAKLSAAGTMAMLPVVVIGWVVQRQLVRGLSLGAVK